MELNNKTLLKIGISIFILFLLFTYWSGIFNFLIKFIAISSPIIIGLIIAYILNILMSFYEKHIKKANRIICLILSILTLLVIIFAVLALLIPELISSIKLIAERFPIALSNITEILKKYDLPSKDYSSLISNFDLKSKVNQIISVLTSGITNIFGVVFSVFSGIVTIFLSFMFALYVLNGKDKLKSQSKRVLKAYLPSKVYEKILYTLNVLDESFHSYIVGQCTEAIILGSLCAIGMMILRLPYALMIGSLIALTALIPIAGAYIGGFLGAFMIFTVSPIKALIFIIFLIILQQVEGNLIYPRVVGSALGLPGLWVLAAVTIGGGLLGIIGMLIAVPITATVYKIIKADVNKREQLKILRH